MQKMRLPIPTLIVDGYRIRDKIQRITLSKHKRVEVMRKRNGISCILNCMKKFCSVIEILFYHTNEK